MIDTQSILLRLLPKVANGVHADWQKGYSSSPEKQVKDASGKVTDVVPRWKPVKAKYSDWVLENRALLDAGRLKVEIDIAHLDNNQLDPGNSAENTAAAKGALKVTLEALLSLKDLRDPSLVEELSAKIHAQWMDRNGSWALKDAPQQMVPYEQLSEEEKDKDRVIARLAISAVQEFVTSQVPA